MMTIDDRMKLYYETVYRQYLTRRTPVIIRIDGRAFHTFTRGFNKPFDLKLQTALVDTATDLLQEIQGAKIAYVQSDEISFLLTDYDKLETDAWFGYNIQKIVSISASMFTVKFHYHLLKAGFENSERYQAVFDSRVFNIPKEEVCNYFIWRQQDAIRNSIQALGQAAFPHKDLQGVSCKETLAKLLTEKGIDWEKTVPPSFRYGTTLFRQRPENLNSYIYLDDFMKIRTEIDTIVKLNPIEKV